MEKIDQKELQKLKKKEIGWYLYQMFLFAVAIFVLGFGILLPLLQQVEEPTYTRMPDWANIVCWIGMGILACLTVLTLTLGFISIIMAKDTKEFYP